MKCIKLGTFECRSGKLMVSDPGYPVGTWYQKVLENVSTGKWHAYILVGPVDGYHIIFALIARHESVRPGRKKELVEIAEIGVDSGQAGIYDLPSFRDDTLIPAEANETQDRWYWENCHITMGQREAGLLPFGCVSTSGYGDGIYGCRVGRNKAGEIVMVRIDFLPEEEEDGQ